MNVSPEMIFFIYDRAAQKQWKSLLVIKMANLSKVSEPFCSALTSVAIRTIMWAWQKFHPSQLSRNCASHSVSSLPHQQGDGEGFLEPKTKVDVLRVTKSLLGGRKNMRTREKKNLINSVLTSVSCLFNEQFLKVEMISILSPSCHHLGQLVLRHKTCEQGFLVRLNRRRKNSHINKATCMNQRRSSDTIKKKQLLILN